MNLIVAVDKNWGIGAKNDLLYNLKGDMNHFKEVTMNKVVVMGRKTLESLPKGEPLKNRINVCLTGNPNFKKDGVVVVNSLQQLFEALSFYADDNIFIVGGAYVYSQMLPYCKKAYITKIEASKEAEKFFPNLDEKPEWELTSTSEPLFEDNIVYYFCEYVNKRPIKFNYGYEDKDLI